MRTMILCAIIFVLFNVSQKVADQTFINNFVNSHGYKKNLLLPYCVKKRAITQGSEKPGFF